MALLTTIVLDDCLLPGPPAPSAEEAAFSSLVFFLCIVAKFDGNETMKDFGQRLLSFLQALPQRSGQDILINSRGLLE